MKSQQENNVTFGEFFRKKRIGLEMTLRSFCEKYGYDPGNISRLERGILAPSLEDEKLDSYAAALKIKRDTEEWILFRDLAYIAKQKIPKDISKSTYHHLPALFRTVRGKKLTKKQLEELIVLINQS